MSSQQPLYGDQLLGLLDNVKLRNESGLNSYTMEEKLMLQQKESEEDSKWLKDSETTLVCADNTLSSLLGDSFTLTNK